MNHVLLEAPAFEYREGGTNYLAVIDTTYANNRRRNRWYGVVTTITEDYVLFEEAASGAKAVVRAKVMRMSTADQANALRAARDVYAKKVAALDAALVDLDKPAEKAS